MGAAEELTLRSDEELVAAAQAGDGESFAALYERYFDRVYDFVVRTVRDRDDAADVVQDTFIKAMNAIAGLTSGASFKSWLFTIARNTALNRLERAGRTLPLTINDEDGDEAQLDVVDNDRFADPAAAAEASALSALVWEAAAGLDAKQLTVLDLHVRQGLDSAEIAEVLGVTKNNAYVMVNRLKAAVEDAIGALVIFRMGRKECATLDRVLAAATGEMTPETKKLVDRHMKDCEKCRERRKKLIPPLVIFGAFAPAAAPDGLRTSLGDQLRREWAGRNAMGGGSDGGAGSSHAAAGVVVPISSKRRSRKAAIGALAAGLVLLVAIPSGLLAKNVVDTDDAVFQADDADTAAGVSGAGFQQGTVVTAPTATAAAAKGTIIPVTTPLATQIPGVIPPTTTTGPRTPTSTPRPDAPTTTTGPGTPTSTPRPPTNTPGPGSPTAVPTPTRVPTQPGPVLPGQPTVTPVPTSTPTVPIIIFPSITPTAIPPTITPIPPTITPIPPTITPVPPTVTPVTPTVTVCPGAISTGGTTFIDLGTNTGGAITVSNTGCSAVNVTAGSSTSWLHVSPASQSVAGGSAGVIGIAVSASSLSAGTHTGSFTIGSSGGGAITVTVQFKKTDSPPQIASVLVSCQMQPPFSADLTVTVSDDNGVTSVVASGTGGTSTTLSLTVGTPTSGRWTGNLPLLTPGATITISVSDGTYTISTTRTC